MKRSGLVRKTADVFKEEGAINAFDTPTHDPGGDKNKRITPHGEHLCAIMTNVTGVFPFHGGNTIIILRFVKVCISHTIIQHLAL